MNYRLETYAGDSFIEVAKNAKQLAAVSLEYDAVEFDLNGIVCLVNKDTNLDYLWQYYSDAHIMGWKAVGPYCKESYDKATRDDLAERRLKRAEKEKIAQEEYNQKCAKEKDLVDEAIKDVILLIHPDKQGEYKSYAEKNSQDGYSRAVIDYAETWAKLMQVEIAKGRTKVAEIANECQKHLGYLGITGFQYGCVVGALSHFWVFGEELRRWHNKEYGVSEDAKGVANPAMLTIG